MTAPLPGLVSHTRAGRRVRVSEHPKVLGPVVGVKSNQTDSASVRTTLLRPAYCLVLVTSTGLYVAADDSTGDRNTAPAVTALVTNPGSGGWDGVLTITGHWGTIDVPLSADDTNTAVRDAINIALAAVNPEQGPAVASLTGSGATERVVVTNRDKGPTSYLKVSHDTSATGWGTIDVGTGAVGTEADYVVSEDYCDLLDGNAVAITGAVETTRAGHYDADNLLHATAECLAVLARRGSILHGSPTLVG